MTATLRRRHWFMWLLLVPVLLALVVAGLAVRTARPVQREAAPFAASESPS